MADEKETQAQAAGQEEQQGGQLAVQKIYIKDFSYEAPNTPKIFTEQVQPEVEMQMHNEAKSIAENLHEIILTITVTVKMEEKLVYLIEVKQAGIFLIAGFTDEQTQGLAATACPNILFPYVREAISDMVTKGGFPQFLLNPVNFDAIYRQELARRQEEGTPEQKH